MECMAKAVPSNWGRGENNSKIKGVNQSLVSWSFLNEKYEETVTFPKLQLGEVHLLLVSCIW